MSTTTTTTKKVKDHSSLELVINFSGGKDSCAMLAYICQHYPQAKKHVVFADTGWEHTGAEQWCRDIVEGMFGLELHVVRAKKDFFQMVRSRGKFPSPAQRQCTSDLKRDPIATWIRRNTTSQVVVSCMGLRAAESSARAKKARLCRNRRESNSRRTVWDWLPIHTWSDAQVFGYLQQQGIPLHPVYQYLTRFSCQVCIYMGEHDLRKVAQHNRPALEKIAALETELGFTWRHNKSMADILQEPAQVELEMDSPVEMPDCMEEEPGMDLVEIIEEAQEAAWQQQQERIKQMPHTNQDLVDVWSAELAYQQQRATQRLAQVEAAQELLDAGKVASAALALNSIFTNTPQRLTNNTPHTMKNKEQQTSSDVQKNSINLWAQAYSQTMPTTRQKLARLQELTTWDKKQGEENAAKVKALVFLLGQKADFPRDKTTGVQMHCPFCGPYDFNDTSRLFAFGFQSLGICLGCLEAARDGFKPWRWTGKGKPAEPVACERCRKPRQRVFLSAPGALPGIGQLGVCMECIQAGIKHLTAHTNQTQKP